MSFSAVDILKAKKNLKDILYRTPLTYSEKLSEITGADVYTKWENLQKTRSFKSRGAYNKIYSLTPEERSRGVITASTGNHGLAVAFVAKMMGIQATVIVPENTPKIKVERCRALEAYVKLKGSNYDESEVYCREMVLESGATYVSAFDDYEVIAGQGTIGCEILEEMPETDTVIVPVGGGGLISGIALWMKSVVPSVRVIGAQSTAAYTMYECFKAKKIVDVPVPPTIAEGLAGGISQITLDLVLKYVDDIVLAREEELKSAILWVLKNEGQIVEGSGVVGTAAILQGKVGLEKGEKVVVVCSGGNIEMELLNLPE